jgi:hypothetical protein
VASTQGDYQFTITFDPPAPGHRVGIYLQKNVTDADPGNVENWDIVETSSYTFFGLQPGVAYRAAITIVGTYDETKLVYQTPSYVTVTGVPLVSTFHLINDLLSRQDLNKISFSEFIPHDTPTIATQNLPSLPEDLTHRSQIVSITIKFYINVISYYLFNPGIFGPFYPPSLPSDARLEIESGPEGATETGLDTSYRVFDYMYWKTVKPAPDAFHQFTTVFASTDSPSASYGGEPLDWADNVMTLPHVLDDVFPSDENGILKSRRTPHLRFVLGYPSNQFLTDGVIPAIYNYSIQYTV